MAPHEDVTPVSIHTLNTLCSELVSGRGLLLETTGQVVRLESPASRAVFDWYQKNREKWAERNTKSDVEAIANQVTETPPELPSVESGTLTGPPRIAHLKSIRVHRFAGIHRYGKPSEPPPEFEFEILNPHSAPIIIIEGHNGAGKTSLLSAITWCLTGHVYRSQRPPETAEQTLKVTIAGEDDATDDRDASLAVSPITPIPAASIISDFTRENIPVDTWVELAFVDDEGKAMISV